MFVVCDNYYQSYILWNNVVVNVTVIGQVNPCPPELLQLYFSSFEARIANAISSFKLSNDENFYHLWKMAMSKIKLLDQLNIY